jgi:YidC/Oxa1 family membrane protein insertase
MFTTLIVKPIFNLLVLIYALLPGHNFGLALILFTIIIRLLLWPLVKKQLHQAKAMRDLQPELKRIKKDTKGDKQKESMMMMELYKERGINPFGTFPILIVQFIVLIGLYSGLTKIIHDPHNIVKFAYPALQNLSWMQEVAHNIHAFDNTLFGFIDLSRSAISKNGGGIYWPAMFLVLGSAIAQYFQSKQLLPSSKDQRSLRGILKEAGKGQQADQSEVNAAVGRSTIYFLPVMIFVFTVNLASALSLYWLTGGIVAYIQQSLVLRKDEEEMEDIADKNGKKDVKNIPEAEVVATPVKKPSSKSKKARKRRKRK